MKTLKQIIVEFWFPFTIASLWTLARMLSAPDEHSAWQQTLLNSIGTFAPAFFFLSFLSGQWFRVRKQIKTQDGLTSVEQRVTELVTHMEQQVAHLEKHAKDLAGYTVGGNSYCVVMCTRSATNPDLLLLMAIHHGEYPLIGIDIRICDLDSLKEAQPLINDKFFRIDRLLPGTNSMFGHFTLDGRSSRSFNIFMHAQNGQTVQEVRMLKDEAGWHQANRLRRGYEVLYEQLGKDSPLGANPWD